MVWMRCGWSRAVFLITALSPKTVGSFFYRGAVARGEVVTTTRARGLIVLGVLFLPLTGNCLAASRRSGRESPCPSRKTWC